MGIKDLFVQYKYKDITIKKLHKKFKLSDSSKRPRLATAAQPKTD